VNGRYYGFLVPHYNGQVHGTLQWSDTNAFTQGYHGKLVRFDLWNWTHGSNCSSSVRYEEWDAVNGRAHCVGYCEAAEDACITVLDLETLDENLVGFQKGFVGKLVLSAETCSLQNKHALVLARVIRSTEWEHGCHVCCIQPR
jgi:hypothetical protein